MLRLHILFTFILSLFVIIVMRLFYVQVIASDTFASNDYLRTVRVDPVRGLITDRNGKPLVINETRYLLFAEPKNIEDKNDVAESLSSILEMEEASIEAQLDTDKLWVAISRDISQEQKERIAEKKIYGLGFDETSKRFYPEASLAAHLTGFVGRDDDGDAVGYFGIEGFYNKDLEGLPGILKSERDLFYNPIVVGTQDKIKGEDGRKIVLTIDAALQKISKDALVNAVNRYEAKSGCVTIAEPHTMEILALTCVPDYDPSAYYDFTENEFRNPVVSDTFEPGSIFKPLVVAAALEEKAIKPSTTYNEDGPIKMGKYFIRTWDDTYKGKVNITEILQNSSNVGMVYIGEDLGNEKLVSYIEDYGFGKKTGIDIQGEVSSSLKQKWYDIDYATATFGQGIAVTQIQMLTAFSSIINGGWLMQPHVVKELVTDTGYVQKIEPKQVKKIISEDTSKIIRGMLHEAVKNGEVHWDTPDGYAIGGKTGTAQIAFEGEYDASRTNASFIGFAPVNDPKFVILVTLYQPQASPWASETAAPTFFEIAKDVIVEYNILPD